MSRISLFWFLLTFGLALDQGVKAWIRGSLAVNQSLDGPWPGVFEIKRVTNEGIAFGMFQGAGVMLAPIAIGIALFAIFYAHKHRSESGWTHTAMALLAAGALGNLYDRLFLGGVTDMFWFRLIDFPVFNIADACITIATLILIVKWGLEALPHKQEPLAEGHEVTHLGTFETPDGTVVVERMTSWGADGDYEPGPAPADAPLDDVHEADEIPPAETPKPQNQSSS